MSKKIASFENHLSTNNTIENIDIDAIAKNCDTKSPDKGKESALNILEKTGLHRGCNPFLDGNMGKNATKKTIGNNTFFTCFDGNNIDAIKKHCKDENVKFDKNITFSIKKGTQIYLTESSFPLDEDLIFRYISENKTEKNPNPQKGFESIGRKLNGKKMELFLNPLRFPGGLTIRLMK